MKLVLVSGNEHDSKSFKSTLPCDIEGCFVFAEKAYDTNEIREFFREQKAFVVIPPKRNRKNKIDYDKVIGKLRHKVENFFCRIKRHRRMNTRHEKLPVTYMGFVTLAAIADYNIFKFVHAA